MKWDELKDFRMKKGITQTAIAMTCPVAISNSTIGIWEKEKPHWAIIFDHMCRKLGVTPNQLLGWAQNDQADPPEQPVQMEVDDLLAMLIVYEDWDKMMRQQLIKDSHVDIQIANKINDGVDLANKIRRQIDERDVTKAIAL